MVARNGLGLGVIALGYYAGKKGLITNFSDYGGQIKINGHSYPIGELAPLGTLLVLGASFAQSKNVPDKIKAIAQAEAENPILSFQQRSGTLTGEGAKPMRFVGSQLGSAVPGLANAVAQLLDRNEKGEVIEREQAVRRDVAAE